MSGGLEDLAPVLLQEAISFVKEKAGRDRERTTHTEAWSLEDLEAHLKWVAGWASQTRPLLLAEPADTLQATAPLRFRTPVGFGSRHADREPLSEKELLRVPQPVVLLGGPGSGKTTTLKRICYLLLTNAAERTDDASYPVVLRLRDLTAAEHLDTKIAEALGLRYSKEQGPDNLEGDPRVDGEPLGSALVSILDETGAVLLLDGLDEAGIDHIRILERLEELAQNLKAARLIVSMRHGEATEVLKSFQIREVCPLSSSDQEWLASHWLQSRAQEFLDVLGTRPFSDLAGRPLFLLYLIALFLRDRELPLQPNAVYERALWLLLREWDESKVVSRTSRYAFFGPERKLRFLSALSYHLTFDVRATVFNPSALRRAYTLSHADFDLPSEEAPLVLAEIQSHTGLVEPGSKGTYEFSHLSIQEYLCASHMVRGLFPERLPQYLQAYPAPVAVAVAIASSPADWFGNIILQDVSFAMLSGGTLERFLERLAVERPAFRDSPVFGLALLRLLAERQEHTQTVYKFLVRAVSDRIAASALSAGLQYYAVAAITRDEHVTLRRRMKLATAYGLHTPPTLSLAEPLVAWIVSSGGRQHVWCDDEGTLHPLGASGTQLELSRTAWEPPGEETPSPWSYSSER